MPSKAAELESSGFVLVGQAGLLGAVTFEKSEASELIKVPPETVPVETALPNASGATRDQDEVPESRRGGHGGGRHGGGHGHGGHGHGGQGHGGRGHGGRGFRGSYGGGYGFGCDGYYDYKCDY